MQQLQSLIGREHLLSETAHELRSAVRRFGPQGVGAFEITCSDESEHECTRVFESTFAGEVLPRLKYGERVPFRIANPGARYEWGSIRIAEDHYATDEAKRGFKVVFVKINGHVAMTRDGEHGVTFGRMVRYERESVYCGAIHAMLAGLDYPVVHDLALDMRSEGLDRIALLSDPALAADGRHALFGAVCSARLQARRCALDIQNHVAAGPTLYIVVHGVTLNRPGPDAELIGGMYFLDHRTEHRVERYRGLGDDPSKYRLDLSEGHVFIEDDGSTTERPARDHRELAARRLQAMHGDAAAFREGAAELIEQARTHRRAGDVIGRTLLKALLMAAAATSPTAAALLLVAEGAVGIHHALKLDQAVGREEQAILARSVVRAAEARVDRLPGHVATRVADGLVGALPAPA